MTFYQEARKASSLVCKDLAESGKKSVAFIGAGDLAEIVYLGVKEWGMELVEVYDGDCSSEFLGHPILPRKDLHNSKADAIIVCLYNKKCPMSLNYLPEDITKTKNMYWVFEEAVVSSELKNKEAEEYGLDLSLIEANLAKTPEERIRDMGNAAQGVSFLRNAVKKAYAK